MKWVVFKWKVKDFLRGTTWGALWVAVCVAACAAVACLYVALSVQPACGAEYCGTCDVLDGYACPGGCACDTRHDICVRAY